MKSEYIKAIFGGATLGFMLYKVYEHFKSTPVQQNARKDEFMSYEEMEVSQELEKRIIPDLANIVLDYSFICHRCENCFEVCEYATICQRPSILSRRKDITICDRCCYARTYKCTNFPDDVCSWCIDIDIKTYLQHRLSDDFNIYTTMHGHTIYKDLEYEDLEYDETRELCILRRPNQSCIKMTVMQFYTYMFLHEATT